MAVAVLQMVTTLESTSALPKDNTQNVVNVALDTLVPTGTDILLALGYMATFYTSLATGQAGTLGSRISGTISRTTDACKVQGYLTDDLSGSTPIGSPVETVTFTMAAESATSDLPEEVAIVCSYHGDLTDVPVSQPNPTPPPAVIRPAQRRRGRLFLGPLNNAAGLTAGDGFWRPTSAFREDLGDAFKGLCTNIAAISADFAVGVWSKADQDVYPVVGGYVDDAWDTQRRRGVEATGRTTFTV